jgi:hypothetical protein
MPLSTIFQLYIQGFCWFFWELPPNLNWEILSTKYESEMKLGNNKEILLKVALNTINHTKPKMLNVYLNELEPNRNWVNLQV